MQPSDIFGFVLALLVAGNVALAWTIYATKRAIAAEASLLATRVTHYAKLVAKHEGELVVTSKRLRELSEQSPVELGVRVVELAEAVERLRKTHQKFAGRISQELGTDMRPDNAPPTLDRDALRREHASAMIPAGLKR